MQLNWAPLNCRYFGHYSPHIESHWTPAGFRDLEREREKVNQDWERRNMDRWVLVWVKSEREEESVVSMLYRLAGCIGAVQNTEYSILNTAKPTIPTIHIKKILHNVYIGKINVCLCLVTLYLYLYKLRRRW